jgi:hypothetical protein
MQIIKSKSEHSLQLAHHDSTPISATADGLLVQFKANNDNDAELDSDSSHDIRRRSYTREQKLAAVGYATTKRVWHSKTEQMVLISHKQAWRDLGLKPVQLRD